MDYEIAEGTNEVYETDSDMELYEPVVNIILLKTKLFAVLCCDFQ